MKPESTTLIASTIELVSRRFRRDGWDWRGSSRGDQNSHFARYGREGQEGNLGCSHNGHAALT